MLDTTLLLWGAMNIGLEADGGPTTMSEPDFLQAAEKMLNIPKERLALALEAVCLDARPTFFNPSPPFTNHDVYPWRFNRELSYMSRPLVREQTADGQRLLHWGHRHIVMANKLRTERIQEGQVPKRTNEWEVAVSKHRNKRGQDFAKQVNSTASGRSELLCFLSCDLPGEARRLGDVDVLVIEAARRLVILVECKALTMRRTAHEYANERLLLFGEGDSLDSKSAVGKHLRRAFWVKHNVRQLLQAKGVQTEGEWEVRAVLVFESDVLSSYSATSPMPLMDFEAFKRLVREGSLAGLQPIDWEKAAAGADR